jgi:tetratricopeptide (TPR) repeat protein
MNFEEGLRRNAQLPHPSAWPLIDYGTYFNLQGNFAKARELLLQSLRFETNWDTAYDELSKAYRGLGMNSEAIDALRHAIALNSGKAEYHYVLARLLTQAHRAEEAKLELALYARQRASR